MPERWVDRERILVSTDWPLIDWAWTQEVGVLLNPARALEINSYCFEEILQFYANMEVCNEEPQFVLSTIVDGKFLVLEPGLINTRLQHHNDGVTFFTGQT